MDKGIHDDVEKRAGVVDESLGSGTNSPPNSNDDYRETQLAHTKTMSTLQRIQSKLNVETRGIERVPEEERTDNSYWNIGSMVLLPCVHSQDYYF